MGATIATLSAILKDMYLPPVTEQLNNEVLLLNRLETRTQDFYGNQAVLPIHTGRSGGIGARDELDDLPTAGNQSFNRVTYQPKSLYGRVQVSGQSMMRTRSDSGAFLQSLKSELDGIRNDLKRDLARQTYGAGDAKVATCGTTTSSTTVVLSSREPLDKGYLYVGLPVDIGTVANPQLLVTASTITAVNAATPSITIGTAISTTNADFVFISGAAKANKSLEVNGLQGIVSSTAVLGGIDPTIAGNEFWQSLSIAASGGNVALDDFQQAFNRSRLAGGEISAIITSFGVQRKYFNLLQSQVRYVNPMEIKGGFQTLEHMGVPIIADRDHPWGSAHFLDERFIKVFSPQDWHFLEEDGNVLKWVLNKDAWQAVLARYLELGATRRNTQIAYTGVTDTTGY